MWLWVTRSGCMRMRRRSESFPDVSASYLLAQRSASEEINSNSSETERTREWNLSIRAHRRGSSIGWSPPSGGQTYLRIRGLSVTEETAHFSFAESS
jgi:hypothetical protein